jgi:methylenetetrahydrofolate reductase (NADPH)
MLIVERVCGAHGANNRFGFGVQTKRMKVSLGARVTGNAVVAVPMEKRQGLWWQGLWLRIWRLRSADLMKNAAVSFEFFPPNDDAMARQLWEAVGRLAPLAPKFVSVTYGADGSTRSRTHDCVLRMLRETNLCVAPHLTCIGATKEEVLDIAKDYWRQGIRHMVALRGDLPGGAPATPPGAAAGFTYASELVEGLAGTAQFDISVAAYPEGHPESGSVAADVENLRRKIAAGATRAITQFFFDTDVFLRYRDRCAAAGIHINIVPGILPITRFPQLQRFAERCGASIPDWLRQRFDGLDDDAETRRMIAAHVAIEQVQRLQQHGVEEFHFYTLNRAELTYAICHALGLRPGVAEAVGLRPGVAERAQVA